MFSRDFIPRVLYGLLAVTFASVPAPAQEPSANEIMARVASTYASCRSYYDEGSIKSGSKGLANGYFRTTFVRPNHLAFELWLNREDKENERGWVVWKNGDQVTSLLPRNIGPGLGPRREVPLDMALERLAFPSAGSSLAIAPLLSPDLFRTSDLIAAMSDVRLTGKEKIDGRETFRLEGKLWRQQPIKLWIDKTQYVIVKTSRKLLFGGSEIESTVLFKPKLNTDIPPEFLQPKIPDWREGFAPLLPKSSASSSHSLRPELKHRRQKFGSSLALSPDERARRSEKRAADEDDVVRVDTDLVVAAVLVLDGEGKTVAGLSKEDFVVKEDNSLQEVASVSLGDSKDVPRSIVLIIDYSGSQLPYIQTSIDAAKMLVDKLNPKDRMAVVTDDVNLLVDFTSDKDLLKKRLESLRQSVLTGTVGASNQYDALLAAMTELFSSEDTRPIIIFQTDGDELEALKGGSPQPYNAFSLPRKFGLEDILTATERSRVAVYSVISGVRFFGVPESELLKRAQVDWSNRANAQMQRNSSNTTPSIDSTKLPDEVLQQHANIWVRRHTALAAVAKFTGAWTEFLEEPSEADEIYNRILTDIDRRYVIGYYPTNRARDGGRRKVQIEIRNHPEYVVWGQKTYFAREER
ncbi:MAG: VWA domain-containing protein [Pyrinomonadaceae bacterium]